MSIANATVDDFLYIIRQSTACLLPVCPRHLTARKSCSTAVPVNGLSVGMLTNLPEKKKQDPLGPEADAVDRAELLTQMALPPRA